jgi:predicted phage tail protein
MTTVSLAGRLGEIVGANFSFKTRNLREVLAAIESNTGRLRSYLAHNGKRRFAIFINNKEIDPDAGENIDVRNKKVLIIPLLMGGFVATTAAIVSAMGFAMKAGAAITIGGKIATFVVGTLLGAALSFGISLLISKLMKPDDPDRANTTSFLFGQAENVARQGIVVPVGYGRMIIGSRTVSVNLFQVDRSLYDKARGGGGLGSIASMVKDPAASISPTNDGVIKISEGGASEPIDYTINSDGSSSSPVIP